MVQRYHNNYTIILVLQLGLHCQGLLGIYEAHTTALLRALRECDRSVLFHFKVVQIDLRMFCDSKLMIVSQS